jgi:hypothetical protein
MPGPLRCTPDPLAESHTVIFNPIQPPNRFKGLDRVSIVKNKYFWSLPSSVRFYHLVHIRRLDFYEDDMLPFLQIPKYSLLRTDLDLGRFSFSYSVYYMGFN